MDEQEAQQMQELAENAEVIHATDALIQLSQDIEEEDGNDGDGDGDGSASQYDGSGIYDYNFFQSCLALFISTSSIGSQLFLTDL